MTERAVEKRQLLKVLRWWDGFAIALCNPGFLVAALGFSIGALGTWSAVALWAASAGIGLLQSWIYAEMACMFPDKPGGISLYAHEGWRARFSLIGPLAAFGYWIGWSVVLSVFGKVIGNLVQARWFPHTTWTVFDGVVHVGLSHIIAIGCIVLVWLVNVFGIRPAVWISYVTGTGLMVPLAAIMIAPYFTGDWHLSNMAWGLHGFAGIKLAMVYLFLCAWSAYTSEVCATFAPEYLDTRRDTSKAMRSSAAFTLGVFLLFPLGLGGATGVPDAGSAEGQFYIPALTKIAGSGMADMMLVLLIGSLLLSMISSTADASRALYGIARDDMTIRQLFHLNKHHVPSRAMTVDMVVNVLLVLFVSSNLAILYLSNIGYVLSHVFALSGFLLLRRDRPCWPRPIKVGTPWVVIAAVLMVFNAVLVGFGVAYPSLTGYGTWTDLIIGVGVLLGSVLLFAYRRIVQDGARITLREPVALLPSPEQMAPLGAGGGSGDANEPYTRPPAP
ncbi:APC family permease [Streptomyces sp. NBC_00457]|uniref:APC family permease n=1 Tax=unclassified Streptomyces TaxID=2593676 RepID=UPI002E1ABB52|nr:MULTISPECIES: APC family permease [unclassified Streptomyces]